MLIMGTITFQTITPIDLEEASQEKNILVRQIADSAASPRPFRREMRFWREMPKDLYHLYQINKLDCISEAYGGTGHLSICTKAVPTCTTYMQGKASSELVKAASYKAKGNSRSQSPFFLAGPLSLIFSSVKVTASEESKTYAGVTVSMTSVASKISGKYDSGSHLSSPKLASAKYRQHRSAKPEVTVTSRNAINGLASAHMVGLCSYNILNTKAESAFVQSEGKEKGPAVSPALLSTLIISNPRNSQGLEHNCPLQATGNLSYSRSVAPQWAAGFSSLRVEADINRFKQRFFCVRDPRCAFIMVRRNGGAFALAGFFDASLLTPIRLATLFSSRRRGSTELVEEATTMATTQTRPEFIDTYWIIPEYETTPYGKVSFTRQDRRTFIALFKDSRLIWAGRQRVNGFTQCLKDPKSQKVGVKRSANSTMSAKGTESCRGQSVSDIVTQGGVNITSPSNSTITNIVTVPATVSDIATVQEVAHA